MLFLCALADNGGAFMHVVSVPVSLRHASTARRVTREGTFPGPRNKPTRSVPQMRQSDLEGEIEALQREQARIAVQIQEKQRQLALIAPGPGNLNRTSEPARKHKILVIVPFPLDEQGVANRRKQAEEVQLGPETQLDFRPIKAGCTSFESDHDWLLMDLGVYEAGINAEDEGYSAVVVDCTAELGSGVGALRSTLSIPVIGPGRASCLYALMLGNKFGILASNEDGCFQHRNWVEQRGLSKFLAAVEPTNIHTDVSALNSGREEEVFPKMLAAAERAIGKGAEVIILGSTTMHEAGEWLSERLPVPVVNPGPVRWVGCQYVNTSSAFSSTSSASSTLAITRSITLASLHLILDVLMRLCKIGIRISSTQGNGCAVHVPFVGSRPLF